MVVDWARVKRQHILKLIWSSKDRRAYQAGEF